MPRLSLRFYTFSPTAQVNTCSTDEKITYQTRELLIIAVQHGKAVSYSSILTSSQHTFTFTPVLDPATGQDGFGSVSAVPCRHPEADRAQLPLLPVPWPPVHTSTANIS